MTLSRQPPRITGQTDDVMSAMTEVTVDLIERGRSRQGGRTKEQLAILGVPWPPRRGWMGEACGKGLTSEQAIRFVEIGLLSYRAAQPGATKS